MTFFDKFFASSKIKFFRCKDGDNTNNCSYANKIQLCTNQVRVVVFRECERRGRKLLFDSDAVEKVSLDCAGQPDVVEVSDNTVYKYKKPCKDVASMGEMIFGTVAMSSRVRTSYKIHVIPTPHSLLFTSIVPCNSRCSKYAVRRSSGSRPESLPDPKGGSDSVMYRGSMHRTAGCSSLKTLIAPACCDEDSISDSLRVPPGCDSRLTFLPPSRRSSDARSFSSCSSFGDSRSSLFNGNCSGGSLSSLRRRWNQSLAVSLDGSSCDEGDEGLTRIRTKLGVCLSLKLTGPHQTDVENFLLSNGGAMDNILSRLIADVKEAYGCLDAFVQFSVAATEAAAASVQQLVSSRCDSRPKWMNPVRTSESVCCPSPASLGQDGLPRWLRPPACFANAAAGAGTHYNFSAAFSDVLHLFDTKSTNFFVSTLLTALLTHNLGWVNDIARRKSAHLPEQVMPFYMMDFQNSLKTVKVVIADSQDRPALSTLIDVLSFFLRGGHVVEHIITSDFAQIIHPLNTEPSRDINAETSVPSAEFGVDCFINDKNIDEGLGQDSAREASVRWRTAANAVLSFRRNQLASQSNLPLQQTCEKEADVVTADFAESLDVVDSACAAVWGGDDNFDSGVDCELRDVVACSLNQITLSRPLCSEILVGSAAAESSKADIRTFSPKSREEVIKSKSHYSGISKRMEADVDVCGSGLVKPKHGSTTPALRSSTVVEGSDCKKALRKTFNHCNLKDLQLSNKNNVNNCTDIKPVLSSRNLQSLHDGDGVDECDFARNYCNEAPNDNHVTKKSVVWLLGDDFEPAVEDDTGKKLSNSSMQLNVGGCIYKESEEHALTENRVIWTLAEESCTSKKGLINFQEGLKQGIINNRNSNPISAVRKTDLSNLICQDSDTIRQLLVYDNALHSPLHPSVITNGQYSNVCKTEPDENKFKIAQNSFVDKLYNDTSKDSCNSLKASCKYEAASQSSRDRAENKTETTRNNKAFADNLETNQDCHNSLMPHCVYEQNPIASATLCTTLYQASPLSKSLYPEIQNGTCSADAPVAKLSNLTPLCTAVTYSKHSEGVHIASFIEKEFPFNKAKLSTSVPTSISASVVEHQYPKLPLLSVEIVKPVVQCGNSISTTSHETFSCNSFGQVFPTKNSLYPDLTELALMENVPLESLTSSRDKTLFVEELLTAAQVRAPSVSPTPDEGYETLYGEQAKQTLLKHSADQGRRSVVTRSLAIDVDCEPPFCRSRAPMRSRSINIPVTAGLGLLQSRARAVQGECSSNCPPTPTPHQRLFDLFQQVPMPGRDKVASSRVVPNYSQVGGVSSMLHPHQLLQGVRLSARQVESLVRRDLKHSGAKPAPVCVLADMDSWCVWVHGSTPASLGSPLAVRASPAPLVADMIESFAHLHRLGVPPRKCQEHLERKLEEIFTCSENVAEMLLSHDFCTVEKLTSHLHLQVNDVPLLLAVATAHTPEIGELYGVTIS